MTSTPTERSRFIADRRPAQRAANRRAAAHRLPCAVRVVDPQRPIPVTLNGQTLDLSPEQIVLLLPRNAAPGTRIEASIWPREHDGLSVVGRVTRCRRVATGTYEVGVELAVDPG